MRKEIVLPAAAAAGGAAGFALRKWELAAAFEPGTGLPISGTPATAVLIVLSAAVAAVLLILCLSKPYAFSGGYDAAFASKGNTLYAAASVLSAFLLLIAALLMVWLFLRHENTMLTRLILALLCAVSFACILFTAKNNLRGASAGKYSLPLLMPAYMACMWLVVAYQARAADPVILDYVYELFAIMACLLGLYFTAGFSFERPKVRQASFFSLLGVYFSIVTLADAHDPALLVLYLFAIIYLFSNTVLMLYNVRVNPPAPNTDEKEALPDEP